MKFLTLADWTGLVETELLAQTCKNYGPRLQLSTNNHWITNRDWSC
jgi:hypothetical protein